MAHDVKESRTSVLKRMSVKCFENNRDGVLLNCL